MVNRVSIDRENYEKNNCFGCWSWYGFAFQLARSGADEMADHKAERAQKMQERRQNYQYLPEILFQRILVNLTGSLL